MIIAANALKGEIYMQFISQILESLPASSSILIIAGLAVYIISELRKRKSLHKKDIESSQ